MDKLYEHLVVRRPFYLNPGIAGGVPIAFGEHTDIHAHSFGKLLFFIIDMEFVLLVYIKPERTALEGPELKIILFGLPRALFFLKAQLFLFLTLSSLILGVGF